MLEPREPILPITNGISAGGDRNKSGIEETRDAQGHNLLVYHEAVLRICVPRPQTKISFGRVARTFLRANWPSKLRLAHHV
jgi:hypothetical protein